MGNEFFDKVQYGKENSASRGTPVAATRMFVGQMQAIKTDRKVKFPKEHIGVRADGMRALVGQYLYENTLSVEDGCFQHLPFLFGCGVKGAVVAAEQTPGEGDYAWDFTPSLTGANNPDSATLRMGDDVQAWIAEYSLFKSIRLSGTVGQGPDMSPVKTEAEFFSRQIQEGVFTNAIVAPNLEPLNAKLAQLYMDDTWANVGNTELANLLRSFDIQILTGVHPLFAGSTEKIFNKHGEGVLAIMGTFGIEGGASANTILSAQQAGSFKAMRLQITGAQIGAGTNHVLTLDFGGAFSDVSAISGADRGDNLATFAIQSYYDQTGAKVLVPKVTTDINAY